MNASHVLREEARAASGLARRIRDLCGDDDQAFLDTLEGETDTLEAFRRVVRWTAEQEAQAAAMKDLANIYSLRAKVLTERSAQGRTAMMHGMMDLGEKTLRLPEATLSVAAGQPKLVGEILNPDALPDDLVRVKREPNMAAIKAAVLAGAEIEGVSLSNAEPHLTVRRC